MRNFKLFIAITPSLLCFYNAHAAVNTPTTFVGPTVQASYSGWINPQYAYSALGELGVKNFRISLTGGWLIDDWQRAKITGEYLWQDITYLFAAGTTNQWMQQGALGADYQHDFGTHEQFMDLGAYVAYAPSKNLNAKIARVVTDDGISVRLRDLRRVAGSNAYGISPGLGFILWPGSVIGINLNYDYVNYNTENTSDKISRGFGGTIRLDQQVSDMAKIELLAAFTAPFNNYQANFFINNIQYKGRWGMGIFGSYVEGHYLLPNTWNAGVNVSYYADCVQASPPPSLKGEMGVGGCPSVCTDANHPYLEIPSAATPPQRVASLPPDVSEKLPIEHGSFYLPNNSNSENQS